MYAKLKVMLCCIALAGTIGTMSFVSYAQNDDIPVTGTTDDTHDYEEILSPYQDVFNEFNNTHGTKYGFMTDEQLTSHNMNREEYLKEMVDTYSGMTSEEFYNFLEEAYINDVSAGNQDAHDDDIPVTETTDDTSDYEEILSPYQDVFNEFNNTHGTKYGFMTDEQLTSHNMNREEYLKEMVDTYSGMTSEEFYNFLEEAYINDVSAGNQDAHAENLPYYQQETTSEYVIVHRVPDKNGGFTFLNE